MSDCGCGTQEADKLERKALLMLLAINAFMFVTETTLGWLAQSAGLIADALDMFADAAVYGIALYAVGRSLLLQARAAQLSGILQILLGLGVIVEVARRFLYGSEPMSLLIIAVGLLALFANLACMAILSKHRDGGVHMRASWIFSTNDVIANLGVILSGVLVAVLDSNLPDLIVGAIISALVIHGGIRILEEARSSKESASP